MFNYFEKRSSSEKKQKNTPSSNEEMSIEDMMKFFIEKSRLLEKELQNGDPIARPENLVDGWQTCHRASFLVLRQGYFRDKNGICAVDYQVYPRMPDSMGTCPGKAFIGRNTIHLSPEAAEEWYRQNFAVYLEQERRGKFDETNDNPYAKSILPSKENKSGPMGTFIVGREYNYLGSTHGRECLYTDGHGHFNLEVTVTAKEPDTFGLQGDKPYIIHEVVPLTEKAADLWVRQTGAPDAAPEMYVRNFRTSYTSLNPNESFDLPNWRFAR